MVSKGWNHSKTFHAAWSTMAENNQPKWAEEHVNQTFEFVIEEEI